MEAWEYEYDLHKHIWITIYLSPPLTHCSFIYFPCVFGTWIRRCSLQCVESVVRLYHQSVSCVSVLSVLERCRSVKGRCSSTRLVLVLVFLHYWWSASLSSCCMLCDGFSLTHTLQSPDMRRTLVPWMIWEAWFLCQSLYLSPSSALQSGI